ncbi:MAG TPA: sodium:alanine symporter family protein [Bacteroidales bacterium]|nr:sodium:alanine symporter family protein [Bacteroidales bacterium]
MQKVNDFLVNLDGYIGGHSWFVFLLLGTGIFFTIYLGFPQIKYFRHAIRITKGKYDHHKDIGDTSHFQALTTALSGTVGTGNIAGVALAIHLGGPAALFWMLVTAMIGMCTKFVEVTISHKYRDILTDGSVSGGPMYYMKKKLNIKLGNGGIIKTGVVLGGFFAVATVLSSFGTGSLPQINSISNSVFATFGINHIITGFILAILLALVIIGGIKRIAKVTSTLVPAMALIYLTGALAVILKNYDQLLPSIGAIFGDAFTGTAATGGFLGASLSWAINRGVNRGLFSNEAGQGSAPIAHSAAKAPEPVSEGMVAILEPFIDTICICTLTGLVLISSGVWNKKHINQFQETDMQFVVGSYDDADESDRVTLANHISRKKKLPKLDLYSGTLTINEGLMANDAVTLLHAESVAEDFRFMKGAAKYTGTVEVAEGKMQVEESEKPLLKERIAGLFRKTESDKLIIEGKSLMHSAPLTAEAFTKGFFGDSGKYIVSIGLLLFAFSTAISWSYYGDRALTYLIGQKYVIYYRIFYVVAFFIASFTDTTIIWSLSYITIAIMTIPNLIGILILQRDVKGTIKKYWKDFSAQYPEEKISRKSRNM